MVSRIWRFFSAAVDSPLCSDCPFRDWRWDLGSEHPGWMGLRHREFYLVDRNRACGHLDFRNLAALASEVAYIHQPYRRSNDHIRGALRGDVSSAPPRATVACLLAVSVSQYDVVLAAIPKPSGLGCIRGLHLPDGFALVLVRRTDSRSGYLARPRPHTCEADRLRVSGYGLARLGCSLEALRNDFAPSRRPRDSAGDLRAHGGELRLRHRHLARMAHDHLSSLFRRGRNLFGICHGPLPGDSLAKVLWTGRLHHHAPPRQHGKDHAGHRADRGLRLHDGSLHGLLCRGYL